MTFLATFHSSLGPHPFFFVLQQCSNLPLLPFESMRVLLLITAAFVVLGLLVAQAAHVCKTKDCSDVVGDAMVKDNLGNSKHFTERHHEDWKEESRKHRIEIARREKGTQ